MIKCLKSGMVKATMSVNRQSMRCHALQSRSGGKTVRGANPTDLPEVRKLMHRLGPADTDRVGASKVGMVAGAPVLDMRVPLPQMQGEATRWNNYDGRI